MSSARDDVVGPQAILSDLVDLRFGMFNHFNLGTFTDEEWAAPNQDPKLFAPSTVDCAQWAAVAAAAKMSYGILTTKHHDGFCLWPSAHSDRTVAHSSYPYDIVEQYVTAFRAQGLKVGLYFSIWDRSRPVQAYNTRNGVPDDQAIRSDDIGYVLDQITELLTNYGPIDLFVTDGYAWQMGQQAIAYQRIREHVRSLQPGLAMVDHGALSVPFLGDAIYFEEPLGITCPPDNTYAALQSQTISDGWFWHPSTAREEPLSLAEILKHLTDLEPRYTSFTLNCPPNPNGRLDDNIVARLVEVGSAWRGPDPARPPLPPQPPRVEHPITPVAAYATARHGGDTAGNAIDGRSDNGVETCWSTRDLPLPQAVTIDLGGVWSDVGALEYLPKQWERTETDDGDITECVISTSTAGVIFTPVATATWSPGRELKFVEWPSGFAGFVRVEVIAAAGGHATVAGLRIGSRTTKPMPAGNPFPGDGTAYRLVAASNGQVVEMVGSSVRQRPRRDDHPGQRWTITPADSGYYAVRNLACGALLEVTGGSRADGGPVGTGDDAGTARQHWAITPSGDGHHLLTNRFSGRSLSAERGSFGDETELVQSTYTGAPHEEWQITTS